MRNKPELHEFQTAKAAMSGTVQTIDLTYYLQRYLLKVYPLSISILISIHLIARLATHH